MAEPRLPDELVVRQLVERALEAVEAGSPAATAAPAVAAALGPVAGSGARSGGPDGCG